MPLSLLFGYCFITREGVLSTATRCHHLYECKGLGGPCCSPAENLSKVPCYGWAHGTRVPRIHGDDDKEDVSLSWELKECIDENYIINIS